MNASATSSPSSPADFNPSFNTMSTSHTQTPRRSIMMVVNELNAAVEASSGEVTIEILRATQGVVSKMQKAVGYMNAPHPEVEAELQEEIAQIEPKIVQGTVTKAEADHLHSLEARAHGYTEKGGIAAAAQSIAAKRERKLSLSSASGSVTSLTSGRSRANSRNFTSPHQHAHTGEGSTIPKIETITFTSEEPDTIPSCEASADKGGSFSDISNTSSRPVETSPKEKSLNGLDLNKSEKS
ncbi:hypothetical protein GMOD_00002242 [Pyrenophora seminiperda CCB06]|uniref:SMP domain-containing protein n=1 Tax=Pyrenophora seminiperda CCB06 TaxID=1302712 RepID=A0A3M7LX75_9PLEO|nr:hypothetical protein GMOD_00002242 [Pyrenophora seminiperda CCB06]